ncbi:hypothetical protein HDU89_002946, partial [Geranomyces variabilis]
MALRAQFCPIASVQNMRDQLHALVQKGSVASYNAEFLRISLQVRNLGPEEESHSYIRGLKPAVQDLVKTALLKSDGSDICDISVDVLQSTALSLGDGKSLSNPAEGLFISRTAAPRGKGGAGAQKKRGHHNNSRAPSGQCLACGQAGHRFKDCGVWKAFQEEAQANLKMKHSKPKEANAAEAHIALCMHAATSEDSLLIDSAASDHMVRNAGWLSDVRPSNTPITVGDGRSICAEGVGTMTIDLPGEEHPLVLTDVL